MELSVCWKHQKNSPPLEVRKTDLRSLRGQEDGRGKAEGYSPAQEIRK